MTNNFRQNLNIISERDGEFICTIHPNESFNIRSPQQSENDKYYSPRKEIKGRFKKLMDLNIDKIVDTLKEKPAAVIVLLKMAKHLEYNTNSLIKNGERYSCNDLAAEMGITKQMASRHIQTLKKANIVNEIKTKYGMRYVVNPYILNNGTQFPKAVLNLFSQDKANGGDQSGN